MSLWVLRLLGPKVSCQVTQPIRPRQLRVSPAVVLAGHLVQPSIINSSCRSLSYYPLPRKWNRSPSRGLLSAILLTGTGVCYGIVRARPLMLEGSEPVGEIWAGDSAAPGGLEQKYLPPVSGTYLRNLFFPFRTVLWVARHVSGEHSSIEVPCTRSDL